MMVFLSFNCHPDLIAHVSPHHCSPLASVPHIRENFLLSFKKPQWLVERRPFPIHGISWLPCTILSENR
ncbi:hypothetical protein J6590_107199, partial [Homalodisca vitripennis]